MLLLSPTCAPRGSWARLHLHQGQRAAATVRARRAQEWSQVVFAAALIDDQCRRGDSVVLEHP
eukprot:2411072-Alexandrium_andersonii.AAC.1